MVSVSGTIEAWYQIIYWPLREAASLGSQAVGNGRDNQQRLQAFQKHGDKKSKINK